MQWLQQAQNLLTNASGFQPAVAERCAVAFEVIAVGQGEVSRRAHAEVHDLTGRGYMLEVHAHKLSVRLFLLHAPDHGGDIGQRSRQRWGMPSCLERGRHTQIYDC